MGIESRMQEEELRRQSKRNSWDDLHRLFLTILMAAGCVLFIFIITAGLARKPVTGYYIGSNMDSPEFCADIQWADDRCSKVQGATVSEMIDLVAKANLTVKD